MWPLRLRFGQLRWLLERHGLEPAPGSPVIGLEASSEPVDEPWVDDPQVVTALAVLAAPRQRLLLGGTVPTGMLLVEGDAVLRFDIGAEGCMFSAPHALGLFADLVADLAGAEDETPGEVVYASRVFLDVLEIVAELDPSCDVDAAQAALAGVSPGPMLDALEADGALTRDGDRLTPSRAWLERHSSLLTGTGLKLVSQECVDLAAGRSRPTALTIVESDPRRVVVLPPTLSERVPDTILAFEPLTRAGVRAAVFGLLEPPATPPTQPQATYDGDPRTWLSGADDDPPAWRAGFWERIALLEDDLPEALVAPGATFEFVARGSRHVVGLTASSAVEWAVDGSCVRWRRLEPGQVAPRLRALLAGPRVAVRALTQSGTLLHGVELVVTADATLLQLEPDAEAVPASIDSVLRELSGALAPAA
jgi:hypothetical protein